MGSESTHTNRAGRRRVAVRTGVVAAAVALVTTGGATGALAAPAAPVADRAQAELTAGQLAQVRAAVAARGAGARPVGLPESGPTSFFLRLDTPATSQVYADTLATGSPAQAADAARAAKPGAEAAAADVVGELPAAVPDAEVLYTASTVLTGVAVAADAADHAALGTLPGVTAVLPITPKTVGNTGAARVVDAVAAWQDLGNTGEGVSIGIIDTGIDYTHADFGGSGDVAQFTALQAAEAAPAPAGVYPNAKVVGGRDFVGDTYNADPASPDFQPVARPDENPLDCNGHGTHVAGTAAGYGVTADGATHRGGYDASPDLGSLRIGPGTAPEASLYALKVFGCEGSTDVTVQAIEWAMDPNGDGSIEDHLDVVNLSLGSDYGLADDADAVVADEAMKHGMLVVMSAGNAADSFDIGGSPGNAPRGIAVAAANDGYGIFDGWQVVSGGGPEGVRPGLRSIAHSDLDDAGAVRPDVTAPVVLPEPGDDPTACAPWSGDYRGEIVLVQAAGFACGSVAKGGNARDSGAAGFMIVGDDDLLETGISGVPEIPGILTTATDGAALGDAVAAGRVTVTFGPSLEDAATVDEPAQIDLLASFSSRGTRQANGLKPDVSAPGVTVYSAAVGTGTQGVSESGTSMAAPVTAGVTALVRAAHPDWTTEEVKAGLMNTAGSDARTADGTVYGPNRQGAGRIDARAALANQVLAYADAGSGVVSASFGVVEAVDPTVVQNRQVTVANKSGETVRYTLAYQPLAQQPGVTYRAQPEVVTVAPHTETVVDVVMTVHRDQLRKVPDPTVVTDDGRQFLGEASGRLVLTPGTAGAPALRVPVHANAKPASDLVAQDREPGETITLVGRGVANGTFGEASSYTSLVSAFERLGVSPQLPRCTTEARSDCYKSELERSVDLAQVGVASDVAASPADPWLYVGVSAHGRYTSPETAVNYGVHLDATGDGAWDYQVTTTRIADLDAPLVVVTDREFGLLPSAEDPWIGHLNVADGTVDTNAFDSDVQLLAAPLSVMPLIDPAASRISFGVRSTSAYGTVDDLGTVTGPDGGVELAAERMSFDPLSPGLSFTASGGPAVLVPVTGGSTLSVTQSPAYAQDTAVGGPKGAMVVLQHNGSTGPGRTQFVPVGVRPDAATAP